MNLIPTLVSLEKFIGSLDAYCIQCEQDSFFKQEKHMQIKPVFHGVEVDEAIKQIRDPEYFKRKKEQLFRNIFLYGILRESKTEN